MVRLLGVASIGLCVAVAAVQADTLPVGKAPASKALTQAPAVDGINGKAEALGGSLAGHTLLGAAGSFSIPLAYQYGLQVDGLVGTLRNDFLGGVAVHAFWRDPARGLVGAYGSFSYLERFGGARLGHFGLEGALYIGRATLEGVIGVQSGSRVSGAVGRFTETIDLKTRFFDRVDLAYYLSDDVRLAIGHRYTGGRHQLAVGGEWGFPVFGDRMAALFVEGRLGQGNLDSVWGGIRVYTGQKPKSLIRRHREDDPGNALAGEAGAFGNAGGSSPASTAIVCGAGFFFNGVACQGL